MTQNSINRLDYIDALRALAALLVVWMHVSEAFVSMPGVADRGTGLFEVAHSVDFGRIGVITFFWSPTNFAYRNGIQAKVG